MKHRQQPAVTVAFVLGATLHVQALSPVRVEARAPTFAKPSLRADPEEPPAGLTRDDWRQIRHSIERSEYHANRVARSGEAPTLQAPNRQQAYRTTFRRDGIEIVPQDLTAWRLGISVTGYGYEGDVRPLRPAEPKAQEERVEYRRGPLTEWYVNQPGGLEQGFDLFEPEPRRAEPLVVAMAIQGDLQVSARGEGVSFSRPEDETIVRYAGLKAWDADGHSLRCRLAAEDREIRLIVDAQTARFPVTVDPTFVHEAQLFGEGGPDPGGGGVVSIDGDTMVMGRSTAFNGGSSTGAVYVFVRSGTTWTEQQKIVASDGAADDHFGHAVSLSGDTLIVGAPDDDTSGGGDAGSAYVFVRAGTTWTQQQKIVASDGGADDRFGISVAVEGDTAVAGAFGDDTPGGATAGSAYVFVRAGTSWSEQQHLLASDGAATDQFGVSVSIWGDTVVVGSVLDDTAGGPDVGSAYVFVRSGAAWSEQQKLLASDGSAGDRFGISVSISAETILVGAYRDAATAVGGSAYVFVRSGTTWSQQQKLLATGPLGQFSQFGVAVSISGDTAVVGADFDSQWGAAYVFVRSGSTWTQQQRLYAPDGQPFEGFGGSVGISGDTVAAGSSSGVYVFVRSGTVWTLQQKLFSIDGATHDLFGYSVSLSGDTMMVGVPGNDSLAGSFAGSVYAFVRSGASWTQQQKLQAPGGAAADGFGFSVSLSGDTAVIGAPDGVFNPGSAYVFVRSGTTWTQQQKLLPSDGSQHDWFGNSVSVSGDTVVIGAYQDDTPAGSSAGSAYVFVRSGTAWSEQQKLLAPDGAAEDFFGWSVSASADTVVIGAYLDDTPAGSNAGSAYVFLRSGATWSLQQKLVAPDGAATDQFGRSVSISGETVLVGAAADSTPAGQFTGSAYVFVRAGTAWSQQQKLTASDATDGDGLGWAVSVVGDAAVVGARRDDTPGGPDSGSAYVFTRTGTNWTEQRKLLAPDGASNDEFGTAVAISGDTVVVGANQDDTPLGSENAGSVHVFREPNADLGITKTDGQTTAVPGQPVTYVITVSNPGPSAVTGATVTDAVPPALLGATWTCVASAGSSCTPGGTGSINDTVGLLVSGTATYALTGTVDPAATGALINTATVAPPAGLPDPNPGNNSATDTDTLAPAADLVITKTDSADPVSPGDPLSYVLMATNAGPSDATSVMITDVLPAGVTFVSSVPGPPTCAFAGATLTCGLGSVPTGGSATVTINVTVNASSGLLVNTATVSASETDPEPANNTASAATAVGGTDGELAHGTRAVYDLAAKPGPTPDEDVFRISQKPHSSYEVVVDGTSGDIDAGAGPLLERVAADGATVLQTSSPLGTGSSRSLRWRNTTAAEVESETIRVRSAGCGTDCGPDDVYMIRSYETTYSVPRFNNAGTQVTVLLLQNPTNYTVSGDVYFRSTSGALVAVHGFGLSAKQTLVLNTASLPGANGVSGAITVAHDGRYGDLAGKTVALEPATGFSFDSELLPRLR